jgi:hypothetical protein
MRILRAATRVAVTRQKGTAYDVAAFPEESTSDSFGWRIRLADVREVGAAPDGVERQVAALDEHLSLLVDARRDEFSADVSRCEGEDQLSLTLARGEVTAVFAPSPFAVTISGKRFELASRDAVLLSRGDGRSFDLHPGSQGEGVFLVKIAPAKAG